MDNTREKPERFAVHADDIRESFKLAFDSVKHLTTLSASTLTLFATFLGSIFPKKPDLEVTLLIGWSFVFLILSLVFSTFSLQRIAGLMRSRRAYDSKKRRVRWNVLLPALAYILGLSLFGTAVLLSVFFGAQNLDGYNWRIIIYIGLVVLIVGVAWWTRYRVRIGNERDKQGEYEVLYPGVRDYDELVTKQRPIESFESLREQIRHEINLEKALEAQKQSKDYHDQSSFASRQQAYAELLSVTHPHKLAVIGEQIPVDFLEFRDTVDKIDAQIRLLSPTEVQESARGVVSSFVDCVLAKEEELRVRQEDRNKREEGGLINLIWNHLRTAPGGQASRASEETPAQPKSADKTQPKSADDLKAEYEKERRILSKARTEFMQVTQKDLNGSGKDDRRLRRSLQRLRVSYRSDEAHS